MTGEREGKGKLGGIMQGEGAGTGEAGTKRREVRKGKEGRDGGQKGKGE